uniref:Uncharacterized protein n=1 Tax=Trypanosoma congolense (strain IL3000) TaxID=1068625 RepID=G0UMS3_TRYCI|nr:hypothetical protein, unlikely [Trypanosoma congolense IL3000]
MPGPSQTLPRPNLSKTVVDSGREHCTAFISPLTSAYSFCFGARACRLSFITVRYMERFRGRHNLPACDFVTVLHHQSETPFMEVTSKLNTTRRGHPLRRDRRKGTKRARLRLRSQGGALAIRLMSDASLGGIIP